MSIIAILILSIHYTLISLLCIYGAHRIYHSVIAKRLIGDLTDHQNMTLADLTFVPKVTVQVPLYNEKFVAARIINRISEFKYPREKLHIQIIDDSTDECVNIVAERVRHYQNLGYDIEHVRRINREGYKS